MPPDVAHHAAFQFHFDAEMRREKTIQIQAKLAAGQSNLTAQEWRDLTLHCGCVAWYTRVKPSTVRWGYVRSGMGVNPDGSQNALVDVQMPASGEKLYPQFGRAAAVVLPAQSGYGVVVEGTGCEVVETGALGVERTKRADDVVATD